MQESHIWTGTQASWQSQHVGACARQGSKDLVPDLKPGIGGDRVHVSRRTPWEAKSP